MNSPLRVVHVAGEGLPFSKTGGLADVIGGLPAALRAQGVEVVVVLPAHAVPLPGAPAPIRSGRNLSVALGRDGTRQVAFEVLEAQGRGVRYLLLQNALLFQRASLYTDPSGRDYEDNWLRFAAFAKAAGELAAAEGADIVHAHDWQAALVTVYEAARAESSSEPRFKTVLTIHNLAFQGLFPATLWPELGLPDRWFTADALEFYRQIGFLKGGILFADALTTVSPTYATEILTREHGAGLEGVLEIRKSRLRGILNGADYTEWDPRVDAYIPQRFAPDDLRGKAVCKTHLQRELGLNLALSTPLAVTVSRLTEQKGWDLLLEAIPRLVDRGLQFAALGDGGPPFDEPLRELARLNPGRVAVRIGFDTALAHRLQAGADLFLMPSRYEPCGLNQMYSLRYGTIPVVRATGGLADTVVDAAEAGRGTGYVFRDHTSAAFAGALSRAMQDFGRESWREMQRRGMALDFSWSGPASRYLTLYRELVGSAPIPAGAATADGEVAADERGALDERPLGEQAATRGGDAVAGDDSAVGGIVAEGPPHDGRRADQAAPATRERLPAATGKSGTGGQEDK